MWIKSLSTSCFVFWCSFLLSGCLTSSLSGAAEVCTDRTEFISVMQSCLIDKKQIPLYREKDRAQQAIIKELKKQNGDLAADRSALIEYKDSSSALIEALKTDREERQQLETSLREQLANRPTDWALIAEVAATTLAARWGGGHVWRIGKRIMGR